MKIILQYLLFLLVIFSTNITFASGKVHFFETGFNCSKAEKNSAEWVICTDEYLAKSDQEMNAEYNRLIGIDRVDQRNLRKNQKEWLKKRNLCSLDRICLENSYEERGDLFDYINAQVELSMLKRPYTESYYKFFKTIKPKTVGLCETRLREVDFYVDGNYLVKYNFGWGLGSKTQFDVIKFLPNGFVAGYLLDLAGNNSGQFYPPLFFNIRGWRCFKYHN